MANKQLIEISLEKSRKGKLGGSLDSILFQDICETALDYQRAFEDIIQRLQTAVLEDDMNYSVKTILNDYVK
jgi:hypothetical protein